MTNEIRRLAKKVDTLCIHKIGMGLDDLPVKVALYDYVWDDMTNEELNEEAQEVFSMLCYDNDL